MDEALRLLIVYGTLLPASVALALLLLPPRSTFLARAVLGLTVGYVLAHGFSQPAWPALPPKDVTDWPLWFALLGLVLAPLEAERIPALLRQLLPLVACGLLAHALLEPKLERMERVEAGLWLAGSGTAIFLFWQLSRWASRGNRGGSPLLLEWSLLVGTIAVCLNLSGSQVLSRLASSLGPPLALLAFWAWKDGRSNLARLLVPTFVLVSSAHVLNGLLYSSLTWTALALLAVGILVIHLVPLPNARAERRRFTWLGAGHLLLALVPLGLAGYHEFDEHFRSGGVQDYLRALEEGTLPVEQDEDYGYEDDEGDAGSSGIDYSKYYREDG